MAAKTYKLGICAVCGNEKLISYCLPCGANICIDCDTNYPARAGAALNKWGPVALAVCAVGLLVWVLVKK